MLCSQPLSGEVGSCLTCWTQYFSPFQRNDIRRFGLVRAVNLYALTDAEALARERLTCNTHHGLQQAAIYTNLSRLSPSKIQSEPKASILELCYIV